MSDTIKLIPDCQVSLDGAKLSPEVEASLAKVDIDLDVDLFGQCVLTFNDPKLLLTNGEKFKPGAAIKVEIGFASSLTTVFEGEVVGLEPQFRRDLPLALRVVSQESLHRLALAQMTRSFQNVDDGEVVKQIAQENGLTGEGPSGTKEHVLQSNISDAVLLRRLAQKHGNHLSIDGKKLIIGPPPKGPQISITPDEALRKIKVKIKAGGQISEVTVHGYDPKTKREFVGTAKGQGEVGEGTRDYGKSSKLSFSGGEHQPTDQATAESMAKGRMRKLAEGHVVAHVNIVGNPELIPGADVSLEKIGPVVDGAYRVERAHHEFTKHGYWVQFTAVRTSKTSKAAAAQQKAARSAQKAQQAAAPPAPPPPVPKSKAKSAGKPLTAAEKAKAQKTEDAKAQAKVLKDAAKDGTPFCEECEAARKAQESKAEAAKADPPEPDPATADPGKPSDDAAKPDPAKPAPDTELKLAWSPEKGFCGDKIQLKGTTNLPDGTSVNVALKARQGSSPRLQPITVKVSGGAVSAEWTIANVDFGRGATAVDQVEVEADAQGAAAKVTGAALTVAGRSDAPSQHFSENRTWSSYGVHSRFDQKLEKFRHHVTVTADIMKGWGGTYVNLNSGGITGKAGGAPWDGYRWARSSSPLAMVPDQYYDGTNWKPFPHGFVMTDDLWGTLGFYKDGATFKSPGGSTFPVPFADYDFDEAELAQRRAAWIADTNKRWSEQFALRRHGCTSDASVCCCKYDVQVGLVFKLAASHSSDCILVAPGPLRSNASLWFMGDDRIEVAAHETGHIMDNPDEYVNGAVDPSLNDDGATHGIDPDCIMGQNLTTVKKRHYHAFATMAQKLVQSAYGMGEAYDVVPR